MYRTFVGTTLLAAVTLLFLTGSQPLSAQASIDYAGGSGFLIGFVPKPTDQLYGAGAIWMPGGRAQGWGLLVDGRIASNRPPSDDLREGFTREDALLAQDNFLRSRSSWNTMSAALVRGIGSELAVYAGAGLARETTYSQYSFERTETDLLFFGVYWIELVGEGRTEPNLVAGALYRMGSRIGLQMGLQTAPQGFAVGGYLLLF